MKKNEIKMKEGRYVICVPGRFIPEYGEDTEDRKFEWYFLGTDGGPMGSGYPVFTSFEISARSFMNAKDARESFEKNRSMLKKYYKNNKRYEFKWDMLGIRQIQMTPFIVDDKNKLVL